MFPWKKNFPFNQSGQMPDAFQNMNPKNVEDYIQNVMGNVFGDGFPQQFPFQGNMPGNIPQINKQQQANQTNTELFETNDHIFVKVQASDEQLKNLRIQHSSNQLFILDYPSIGEQKKLVLPALVKRKGTKASYRNGILEIKLQKNEDLQISEIEITND
ncbi:Hsp20/alpha crystallin family protein [Peribacillus frigoritolerans]|uniref:Hsp20/alpha crystallin family protein n=1 Tax=Peribacillus frigoritolerans TaxID=450367 RepID=UPI00105A50B7|nr:Hsp20/alpha crystallin family protein [Peribacillus frigoritolerans]TDL82974.1 spore gernimation protein GerT [Peribacillus frigoritolerans]